MKTLSKVFLTGVAALLPVVVTTYVFWWLERLTREWLETLFDIRAPWPGAGILAGVAIVLLVGLLMRAYVVRTVFRWGESVLSQIPLVKTLYGSVRDLMGYFEKGEDGGSSQVVMVHFRESDLRVLGLLTREDFSGLPEGIGDDDLVAVYLPMSYQLGGYTAMVPRYAITPIDMTMEDAMRFAVTAGMSSGKRAG